MWHTVFSPFFLGCFHRTQWEEIKKVKSKRNRVSGKIIFNSKIYTWESHKKVRNKKDAKPGRFITSSFINKISEKTSWFVLT